MMIQRIVMVVAALLVSVSGADAAQTTYYVNPDCGDDAWSGLSDVCTSPNGPKRTIQPAVDATVPGDTVVLADGTYYMTGTPITFGGKDITLRSANGSSSCVFDGQDQHQAIYIVDGETDAAVIDGITFQHCKGNPRIGGAVMRIIDSNPTITNCVFSENYYFNKVRHGGAIYLNCSGLPSTRRLVIQNSVFTKNGAGSDCYGYGGAIAAEFAAITIESCEFMDNSADSGMGSCHGGITAAYGGAVYLKESNAIISDCRFLRNRAAFGGGLYLIDTSVDFFRCLFQENLAWDGDGGPGGGIYAWNVTTTFSECLFSSNEARGGQYGGIGGGIVIIGSLTANNCTFVSNFTAPLGIDPRGGAIFVSSNSQAVFGNTVFWGNRSDSGDAIFVYPTGSARVQYSLVENGLSGTVGNVTWGSGNISDKPGFANPQSNFRPNRNSPLIDSGDSSVVTIPPLPAIPLDLDGNPRLRDDPGTPDTGIAPAGMHVVDIGCYEFQGSSCVADCDWSTGPGVLDVFDFLCFQNAFVSGEPFACDCDTSTGKGVCDIFDFLCFQNAFVLGCPP